MKFSKSIFTVLVVALALSACAKKESDFAARYAKNGMGADSVDTAKTGEAAEEAEAKGLATIDIINITKASSGAEQVISSVVILNQQQITVSTRHTGLEVRQGHVASGEFTVTLNAVCGKVGTCSPYYVTLQVYKNNQLVIQEGIRKYFEIQNADKYIKLTPARSLPLVTNGTSFQQSIDMNNNNVMVGYLNGNGESGYIRY